MAAEDLLNELNKNIKNVKVDFQIEKKYLMELKDKIKKERNIKTFPQIYF